MASLFTRIMNGEIPSHRVHEDEATFAFLDINPRAEGHTIVVPRREVDYLFDLPEEDYAALWASCNTVARGLKAATGCDRVLVLVLGYEIPHAHVHLIPSRGSDHIPFPPVDADAAARLAETAARIRTALT
jgi:histidine triad (HIT) family protein